MREFAAMRNLEVWYDRLDESDVFEIFRDKVPATAVKRFEKSLVKARSKDSMRALTKLTARVDGKLQIVSDPPLIVRLDDLVPGAEAEKMLEVLRSWFRGYRQSLQPDRRRLLEGFEVKDVARKVVGVGSVGTRCWIAYMQGRDEQDPLFLQIKEAEASVLEPYAGKSTYANHGRRVVEGQRFTQTSSDIFLGWDRATDVTGEARDFYVRQLWDGKLSPQIDLMEPEVLKAFGAMCGSTLARAHARSGDWIAIAPTWVRAPASTVRSPTSPGPTRTRTNVTTRPWWPRSRPAIWWPTTVSPPPDRGRFEVATRPGRRCPCRAGRDRTGAGSSSSPSRGGWTRSPRCGAGGRQRSRGCATRGSRARRCPPW